jgi:serine/threonine protein kinase
MQALKRTLRTRQALGKYRIQGRIARGGFADVYRAADTIEGVNVALKIPHAQILTEEVYRDILQEVRLAAKLNHPNILTVKNADHIGEHFVVAYRLGNCALAERMTQRLPVRTVLDYMHQMLAGVAYAHEKRVLHCDIKPENFILFDDDALKLTDFGIAKIARRTIAASGSGTVGYIAPEQAHGKPSFRSDVFSLGLIFYQMFTNILPEWPFVWPPPEYHRLRRKAHPDFITLIRRALAVDASRRYGSAVSMLAEFERVAKRANKAANTGRKRRSPSPNDRGRWRLVKFREFKRLFGKALQANHECGNCGGPISEQMSLCPWCGYGPEEFEGQTSLPAKCDACSRGMKLDWRFCPHEYGAAQGPRSNRSYADKRYTGTCHKPDCRGPLIPFMKYCPWCRARVQRKWKIESSKDSCPKCGWGIVADFWSHCPWCGRKLES